MMSCFVRRRCVQPPIAGARSPLQFFQADSVSFDLNVKACPTPENNPESSRTIDPPQDYERRKEIYQEHRDDNPDSSRTFDPLQDYDRRKELYQEHRDHNEYSRQDTELAGANDEVWDTDESEESLATDGKEPDLEYSRPLDPPATGRNGPCAAMPGVLNRVAKAGGRGAECLDAADWVLLHQSLSPRPRDARRFHFTMHRLTIVRPSRAAAGGREA